MYHCSGCASPHGPASPLPCRWVGWVEMMLVSDEQMGCSGAAPSVVAPGYAPGRVQERNGQETSESCAGGKAAPAWVPGGAPSRGADGRVKIGQSGAAVLRGGRGVKRLFSRFPPCLVEELEGAGAPLAFPAGTRQAEACWVSVILRALVLRKNQLK